MKTRKPTPDAREKARAALDRRKERKRRVKMAGMSNVEVDKQIALAMKMALLRIDARIALEAYIALGGTRTLTGRIPARGPIVGWYELRVGK